MLTPDSEDSIGAPSHGRNGTTSASSLPNGCSESLGLMYLLSLLRGETLPDSAKGAEQLFDAPRNIGRFRLEGLLGKGAYGAVFRAHDTHLGRRVALKVAWPGILIDEVASQRFSDEPKTIAALEHSGIVAVFESGNVELAWYTALELIDGPNLAEWIKDQPRVPCRLAAEIVRDVARTIHFAHEHDVVHRDLKPSNILLRPRKIEGVLPFEPVVTDFGLAHRPRAVASPRLTATQAVMGTDHYMSPEQVRGLSSEVGLASDIFSLGVILYELVAGHRPFEADSADEIRRRIREEEPITLRARQTGAPKDLETIVLKCLEKAHRQRYGSAQQLADDLTRFLNGEPILGRRTSMVQRSVKYTRRKPLLVSLVSLGLVSALVTAGLLMALAISRISANREIAVAETATAIAQGVKRQHEYASHIRHADEALRRGNRQEVMELLGKARELESGPVQCGIDWDYLWAQANDFDSRWQAHVGHVHAVRFSPRGDVLVSAGEDGEIRCWSMGNWTRHEAWNVGVGEVNAIEFSADGSYLAVAGDNGHAVAYRTEDWSKIFDESVIDGRAFALAWLEGETRFALGGEGPVLTIVDPIAKTQAKSAPIVVTTTDQPEERRPIGEIKGVSFLPGQKAVVMAARPDVGVILDVASGDVKRTWKRQIGRSIANADQWPDLLVIPSVYDGNPAVGDLAMFKSVQDATEFASVVTPHGATALRFSPDGKLFSGAFQDGTVWTWKSDDILAKKSPKGRRFVAHDIRATSIDISPGGRYLASAGWDGQIGIWQERCWGENFDVRIEGMPLSTQFSPCGRWFAAVFPVGSAADLRYRLIVIDAQSGRRLWEKVVNSSPVFGCPVAFSPTGEDLAFSDEGRGLCGHDPRTGEITCGYSSPAVGVAHFVSYSPDGAMLIAGSLQPDEPKTYTHVRCLSPRTGRTVQEDSFTGGAYFGLIRTVLGDVWIRKVDHDLILAESHSGPPVQTLTGWTGSLTTTAVSGDGRFIIAGTDRGVLYVWDLTEPAQPRKYIGHEADIFQVGASVDGSRILSVSTDGTMRIWDMATGAELIRIGNPEERVVRMAMHPSGNMLVLTVEHSIQYGFKVVRLGQDRELLPSSFDLE